MSKATTVKLNSFSEVSRVIWWKCTNFPEVNSASVFRTEVWGHYPSSVGFLFEGFQIC